MAVPDNETVTCRRRASNILISPEIANQNQRCALATMSCKKQHTQLVTSQYQHLERHNDRLHADNQRVDESHRVNAMQIDLL